MVGPDLRIAETFEVPVAGPHGLAIAGERLFCAADGGALVALHRDTGRVLGTVVLPGEPDVVMYDAELGRVYVAIGSPGVVSVIAGGQMEILETAPTELGAHTIAWNPTDRMLYAFQPASNSVGVYRAR